VQGAIVAAVAVTCQIFHTVDALAVALPAIEQRDAMTATDGVAHLRPADEAGTAKNQQVERRNGGVS